MKVKMLLAILVVIFSVMNQSVLQAQESTGKNLNIKMYLEGALIGVNNQFSPDGRILMRDNLRSNSFTGQRYIPNTDPYMSTVGFLNLSTLFGHVGAGANAEYGVISDPSTVFGVTNHNAIVDWVFIELRSSEDNTHVIATRSGLLQRDGDVVDLDGVSSLFFPDVEDEEFYVVARHRNHLGVMSLLVNESTDIDFTNPNFPLFDLGFNEENGMNYSGMAQKYNQYGVMMLWAGNFNADQLIKYDIPNDDHRVLYKEIALNTPNTQMVYGYFQGDFDMNGVAKYGTATIDDSALLKLQVQNYPLNDSSIANFNFLIQQVPPRSN